MPVILFEGRSFPVSAETVVNTVKMLIETGQVEKFIAYCKDKDVTVTVPAVTANALKQFLDGNRVAHPMAKSIVGLRQEDCQDYQCPHINR